ncbi:MAG: hypothetical protein GWN00_36400, partial [Aliifodinibius sp.]|nr:hypothetical protein [Fodinibius sp.]NIV16098.1 hypothetical protein [Fodinibius sp.]NIY30072.1 hypothetical protein [Fodinibius sp.]
WEDRYSSTTHQFVSQFGNFKSIEVIGRSRALITFKNDLQIEVSGEGFNDIGATIGVYDDEIGSI